MALFNTLSTGSIALEEEESCLISPYPMLVDFEAKFQLHKKRESVGSKITSALKDKLKTCDLKNKLLGYFPIIETFTTYDVKGSLPNDLIAGITAGVMMIPQGMAFAALSTLPPIVGLYISLFSSLTYFFLGTGRQLSWGCIAILSLMMADILNKYDNSEQGKSFISSMNFTSTTTNNDTDDADVSKLVSDRRIELASGVSVAAGLILILASRVGLSRVTALMSNSLITGFTVGISFHVATSQLKGLFGLTIPRYNGTGQLIRTWIEILKSLPETNLAVLILSIICMLVIYIVKKFVNERYKEKMRIPIPIELFVLIVSILVSYYARLNEEYDVSVVKSVPTGIPLPKFPDFTLIASYIGDALVIIVVSYAQSLAMAKTMGLKNNYHVDANQEMLAAGMCTVTCGFFSGYITGASVSRTVVQDGAGGKTQIASLFSSGLVLLVIMVIGPYFYHLPKCVLSAIIVINLRTMFLKLLLIPSEWRKSRYDCAVWVFACVGTIILNAAMGLLASILFSLFLVVFRSMVSPIDEVGQIQTSSTDIQLRSVDNYDSVQKLSKIKLIKIKTPLYFFNSDSFTAAVFKQADVNPINVKKRNSKEYSKLKEKSTDNQDQCFGNGKLDDNERGEDFYLLSLKVLIFDLSEVAFIDLMGISALELIIKEYGSIGTEVLFSSIPENLFPVLHSTGFWKKHGDRLFLTVDAALASIAATIKVQLETEHEA